MHRADAVIVGAGAAGLHCAAIAGQLGLRVLLLDHASTVAEKIRISGGGRCNFTNRDAAPAHFSSANPDFCRSALARYTPRHFIALVQRHGIGWHEKHKGQLFCDDSSERIIAMLLHECERGDVQRWQPCRVHAVRAGARGFELDTERGAVAAPRLVVATGGLSIPKIGASDFGYRLARQFGHAVIEPRPALVPLTFDAATWAPYGALSGLSLPVTLAVDAAAPERRVRFDEDLLFTHRGLSGPAMLQVSTFWRPGEALRIDLAPGRDLADTLRAAKRTQPRRALAGVLAEHLPRRLAETWLALQGPAAAAPGGRADAAPNLAALRDRDLAALASGLHGWAPAPSGSEGWRKAEVTAGGVDTRELHSRSMASRRVPGLHFIGEVVDVTGWLGGYNFQWAWASAAACAQALR
ncbi:MAG: NAD(P)/FAD-dependent oxidoreductase [Ideonella sp.]|nr:NAD(P)/FAD-dependent oxidoreductase [Ideonella sp.]MCC7458597.1 NAD(P)/FAD-dependent oxidoreductase [Nitrospira sp.]